MFQHIHHFYTYVTICFEFFNPKARAKYLCVAKQMKAYEDQLYEQWRENVEAVLPALLKRNLLIKPSERQQQQDEHKDDAEAGEFLSSSSPKKRAVCCHPHSSNS